MEWQYRTLTVETRGERSGFDVDTFDSVLNALGREGWELVVALDTDRAGSTAHEVAMVFKRPKPS
jgi:hypothetical protein